MHTLNHWIKVLCIGVCSLLLTACLSTQGLSKKQVKFLQKEGFVLTDDGWSLGLPENLLFEFNESELNPKYQDEIVRLARQLTHYKLYKLKVVGHTDDVGKPEYNLELSENRAQSVSQLFFQNGFSANNVQVLGRGAEQPLVPNDSDENRSLNRRVAVVIVP